MARELEEETGWRLREIQSVVTDWEWEHQGVVRRELDYLVTVDGDLGRPRLEQGKHDARPGSPRGCASSRSQVQVRS